MAWSNKKAFEQMLFRKFGWGITKRTILKDRVMLTRYLRDEAHIASWTEEKGGWIE